MNEIQRYQTVMIHWQVPCMMYYIYMYIFVCVCVCVCAGECQKMPRMIRTLLCNNYRTVVYCGMFTILKYTRIIQVQITC